MYMELYLQIRKFIVANLFLAIKLMYAIFGSHIEVDEEQYKIPYLGCKHAIWFNDIVNNH